MKSDGAVIVLSAYDGARHIEAQIRSIQRQHHQDWLLLVRDDGSSDGTPALVEALAREDPRIRLVSSGGKNLGAVASFGALLAEAAAGTPATSFSPIRTISGWRTSSADSSRP